jgi:DNA (cytosine-5)-methyltransferase 1
MSSSVLRRQIQQQLHRAASPDLDPREWTSTLRIAGLFAGIGGFEIGLAAAGHRATLLCEKDDSATTVLHSHFHDCDYAGDIRQLLNLPTADVLTAGFPCQDLSQVGGTMGIEGTHSALVTEVFRLVGNVNGAPRWVVLENVPFMLHLDRARAIRFVVANLEKLGFHWAYRIVDTRSFGLPQRRRRVFILASRERDPRDVLLTDDAPHGGFPSGEGRYAGFYWTEGTRGIGWAEDGVPPLKGGSGVGIPAPPAIWDRERRILITPDIRDAERLQGFPAGWTACVQREGIRWKLVGNAVSVPVAEWLGQRLSNPGRYSDAKDSELTVGGAWPSAAWGLEGRVYASSVSEWPVCRPYQHLEQFLRYPGRLLSERATAGFLQRARSSRLRFEDGFLTDVEHHLERARAKIPSGLRCPST